MLVRYLLLIKGNYRHSAFGTQMIPLAFFDFGESAVLDVIGWVVLALESSQLKDSHRSEVWGLGASFLVYGLPSLLLDRLCTGGRYAGDAAFEGYLNWASAI